MLLILLIKFHPLLILHRQVIYINESWLREAEQNYVFQVLTEELGHHIDHKIYKIHLVMRGFFLLQNFLIMR